MPVVGAPSTTTQLILDPVTEDATNVELDLTDTNNYGLTAHTYPAPNVAAQWASSVSTEGAVLASQRHENRTITISVDVNGLGALQDLEAKIAKLYREGGTLKRVYSDGREIVFDVLTVSGFDPAFEQLHHFADVTPVTITLECKPYGRGAEETLTSHSETTLPALVFTETGIKGDMPGEGRLIISDAQAKDQWWATWGVQSRHYDSAATAALFYEAEGRTLLGGSTVVTGTSPASGAGTNNVVRASLTASDQAILSTQTTGAGAHLSHVGAYRVYARVRPTLSSTGDITVALQWAAGDFNRPTTNASVSLTAEMAGAVYYIIDLGLIDIPPVTHGTQRWEGRLVARSTLAANLFDIDCLFLVPVDEGSGIASGVATSFTPSSFSARDEFDHAAGSLAGKTLPLGGTWAGAGSATQFTIDTTGHRATRSIDDLNFENGRFALAGTTTFTDIAVGVDVVIDISSEFGDVVSGCVARYTDTSNYFRASYNLFDNGAQVLIDKRVAGTLTRRWFYPPVTATPQLRLVTFATGVWEFYVDGSLIGSGYDADLATGGTLATGKIGFFDGHDVGGFTPARYYDNFWAAVPPTDAAIRASQSLEVRHDGVIREDTTGTIWSRPGRYEGDYLRVPVAGAEARTCRFIVKASRLDPQTAGDLAFDDLTAQLIYTPRYLVVPAA